MKSAARAARAFALIRDRGVKENPKEAEAIIAREIVLAERAILYRISEKLRNAKSYGVSNIVGSLIEDLKKVERG